VRTFWMCLIVAVAAVVGVATVSSPADAEVARKLPSFEMKDLREVEHRLSDERFEGKTVVIAAFGTWQQASIDQARELQRFHEANPNVEIIAFVVDALPQARDFVAREGLTFPCYRPDGGTRIGTTFARVFRTRRGQNLTLNRAPFVIIADANRDVHYAQIGLVDADTIRSNLP